MEKLGVAFDPDVLDPCIFEQLLQRRIHQGRDGNLDIPDLAGSAGFS
ncbi:MAG: hypothetical protein WBA34_08680 [Candidatus Deferrimicrobiaceae bacterium]